MASQRGAPSDMGPPAWRIFTGLGYVVNNHGDRFRPLRIGQRGTPDPNGRTSWLINGGDPNHLVSGDDPLSINGPKTMGFTGVKKPYL